MTTFLRLGLSLGMICLAGCTSVTAFRGLSIDKDALYVSGVAPLQQDSRYACGATCVAAVAAYWSVPLATFREKQPEMPRAATGADLEELAKRLGLQAFCYRSSLENLQQNLEKGRPLIVMISQPVLPEGGWVGTGLISAWNQWGRAPAHWVVVVGIDANQSVIVNDPESGPLTLKRAAFEKAWAKQSNLAVLLAAP